MAAGSDTWDALMVLCAPTVDAGVARDLVDEVGDAQTGLAVVVCGEADGARQCLTLDGSGTSSPLDLLGTVVWPQRVDSSELEGLGGLVAAAADLSSVPVSEAPYELITAPLPRVPVEGVLGSEEPPSFDLPRMEAEAMVETAETETVEPEVAKAEMVEAEAAVEVEVAVLGPVEVHGNARQFTRAWAKELVVYLAMHPGGSSNETWATVLWPDRLMAPSSLHSTASVARRSLGQARDGGDHLPKGHGRLELADTVGTDWDRFVRLADAHDPGHSAGGHGAGTWSSL